MSEVSFKRTMKEGRLIRRIVDRAIELELCRPENRLNVEMDITATHANGCRLDLQKLLLARNYIFAHDLIGIDRYLDRETGNLAFHFDPRCALVPTVNAP